MLILAGVVTLGWTGGAVWPSPRVWGQLAAATVVGVIGYNALTGAMRSGEISVIAPFRYTRLVFAMVLGVLVFGEQPDVMTLVGSAVIVGSGLFTVLRERHSRRMALVRDANQAKGR